MRTPKRNHSGSTFDSFLEAEGIREEVEAVAIKRMLAWQQTVEFRSTGQPRACPELIEGAAVPTRSKTKPQP
jgi:hypothetical protein